MARMTKKIYLNESQNEAWNNKPIKKETSKPKKLNWKVIYVILTIACVIVSINYVLEKYVDFRSKFGIRKPIVVEFGVKKQSIIYELPEPTIVTPIVIEQVEESDVKPENPIDEKIYELWGDRYFLIARSIFKCESGLRADAVNWSSRDIGIAQIHIADWLDDAEREFGYTLGDLFDPIKNLDVAYYIWDIDNGELGDGIGSFNDWVVFENGAFIGCVE